MPQLTAGFKALALTLQEAGAALHSNVRAKLSDAINDAHRKNGDWGGYIDHTGDGESGCCIYSCNGDIRKASYELGSVGDKSTAHIDMDDSTNVVPVTSYQEEADDDDQYAAMSEGFIKSNIYTELPLYERFISKAERDKASEGDFAGKGKSFPILKPSDVSAAVHAMGRAGSSNYGMAQLKANIIRIAKAKGWTSELPKAWRGDDAKEAKKPAAAGEIKFVESWNFKDSALALVESSNPMRMKAKLIAPGQGSSAFYPAEVLKRDGPKVFTKGTHVYINHATAAEEAARPEGDWHKLAGALAEDAHWDESAAQGPGLYANIDFTSDHAPLVKEKAAFTGMSIRASGVAESGQKKNGLPVLKSLTHAESVDVVTRAGAGGMILTESAKTGITQEVEMDEKQIQALVEAAVNKAVAAVTKPVTSLTERALRGDATFAANKILSGISLSEAAKAMIVENVIERGLPLKDGELDPEKFKEAVSAEAKRVGSVLAASSGSGRVFSMGTTEPAPVIDPKEAKRQRKLAEAAEAEDLETWKSLGLSESAAKRASIGRVA